MEKNNTNTSVEMKNLEIAFKIGKLLIENKWEIKSFSLDWGKKIITKRKYIEVSIRWFEDDGRIEISCDHLKYYKTIEHSVYDEALNIFDVDTELNWEIENELIPELDKLKSFIYKVSIIDKYTKHTPPQEELHYFNSFESMSEFITGNQCKDINTLDLGEELVITFPNPNIREIITKVEKEPRYAWEKSKVWFKCRREEKNINKEFEITEEWETYVDVFNK